MGIGMVKPPISDQPTYFFGPPSTDLNARQPLPTDSLTFLQGQHYLDVATAPPWFQPEVLKLDYDLLYVRAVSLRAHWIEVIVNRSTSVNRDAS